MNTLSGVNEPYSTLTLDGLNATTTLIDDAVGDYLPLSGGTLLSSTGTTRLGIAASTQGTVEFTDTAGASKALVFYNATNNDVSFTVGTNTRVLRVGGTQITAARNISMATTNKVINLGPGTTANDAVNYGQTMLRSGVNAATANIPMGGFKLTGLGLGVAGDDAATVSQLTASPHFYLPLAGGTMTGNLVINRGVNPCIFTLASAGNTTIDFKDDNLVLKGSIQYNQPANSLHFDLAGVTRQTISTTATTFSTPVAMSSQKITGLLAGAGGSTDAANVAQMEAADTVVTAAFQAADALKLNRSGVGAMTGALDMGGFLIQQVNAGAAGSTNAANVFQMEAADTVVTNAYIAANTAQTTAITSSYIAADTVVTNAYIAANTAQTTAITNAYVAADAAVVASSLQKGGGTMTGDLTFSSGNIHMGTGYIGLQAGVQPTDAVNKGQLDAAGTTLSTAYIAADAVVTNNSVQKTGSIMSGTLTINNIQTCLQATHTAASLLMTMQGGSSTVPNAALIRMTAGLGAGLEFYDYSGALKGYMRFDFNNTPDRIVFNVGGVSTLILQSAAAIFSQPLAMSTKQITGLQAGSAADHAVNYGQTMLRSGVNSMTASLDMGTQKIINLLTPTLDADAATKAYTDTKAYLRTSSSSQGTLTMSEPSSDLSYMTFKNGYNAGGLLGATHLRFESYNSYITTGSPTTSAVQAGIQLNQGNTFSYFTGPLATRTTRIKYESSTFTVYGALDVVGGAITRNTWAVGETIQRKWLSPALSNSLTNSSCTKAQVDVVVVTTTMTVTVGNKVFVKGSFNISANGYGDDEFTMRAEHDSQYMDFSNVIPTSSGFRERTYHFNALFIPSSSGSKTIQWRIYNQTDSDTLSITASNWEFSIEEVQS